MRKGNLLKILLALTLLLAMMLGSFAFAEEDDFLTEMQASYDEAEMEYRPEIRWWLSEGYNTDETLLAGIESIYEAGFGGIELLTMTVENIDQTIYGWGSEEWNSDVELLLEKATEYGMSFSYTSGANYQPAVPGLSADDEATNWEIDYNWELVSAGETYTGEIPYPETEGDFTEVEFLRLVSAKLVGDYDPTTTESVNVLAEASLTDITDQVVVDGDSYTIEWTAPDDGEYLLFAFWAHGSCQTAESAAETAYVINHFSTAGAEAQIEYWMENIFTEDVLELIAENGNVTFFQDSLEITQLNAWHTYYCEELFEEFEARRGYDITPYLPLIIMYDVSYPLQASSGRTSVLDAKFDVEESDIRTRVLQDLYQTYTELYTENYLATIREWLNENGIQLRAQVSYGQDLETSYPVQEVDIPEMESLAMGAKIDAYRQQTGVAHLYGKNIISSETGAVGNNVSYAVTLQEYLEICNRQFAAGINRTFFHGYATIAGTEDTVWPGFEGYGFNVSERWGERMPNYIDLNSFTDYIARVQKVLRQGVAKVDLAMLQLSYQGGNNTGEFDDGYTLQNAGYTYEYITPLVLTDDAIECVDGVLQPDGPEYQAVVVFQDYLPYDSAQALLEMAQAGLPVIYVEGSAVITPYNDGNDEALAEIIAELKTLDNVAVVASEEEVIDGVQALGISPRVSYSESSQVQTNFREDTDVSYVFVYNTSNSLSEDAVDIDMSFSVEGLFVPYALNAWTGDIEAIAEYSYEDGRTVIPISLTADDTTILILNPVDSEEQVSVVSTDAIKAVYENGEIMLYAEESGVYTAELSNGETYSVSVELSDPIELNEWSLTVEDWQEGETETITEERDGYTTIEYVPTTLKTEISVELDELVAWKDIEEIGEEVSGIGYYTTTFTVDEAWLSESDDSTTYGVYIAIGDIVETASVYVNGVKTDPLNIVEPTADITELLQAGENTLEIVVTSTLSNRLVAMGRLSEDQIGGMPDPSNPFASTTVKSYGLCETVVLQPYVLTTLE